MAVSVAYPNGESNTCLDRRKQCFQNARVKPHEALRFARKRAELTQDQVADKFGISRAAVAQWESLGGTMPDPAKLPVLAGLYKTSIDELLRGPHVAPRASNVDDAPPRRSSLPLISWVAAGLKESAFDPYAPGNAEDWIEFEGQASSSAFCLRVRGDSMMSPDGKEPTFPDGCIIAVEPRRRPRSREFAVFRFNDSDEATFKQYITDGPLKMLKPLNPTYPNIALGPDAQLAGTVFEKLIISRY